MTTLDTRDVAGRPVPGFVALALGVGWPVLCLPALASRGMLPWAPPLPVLVLVVTYGVLVPAAVVLTGRVEGREGLVRLLSRAVRWRFGGRWWVVVLVGVPALTLALGLLLGGRLGPLSPDELVGDLADLAVALLLVHLAEELVWAGFVQTRLAARFGVLAGAALTALPFAAVHLPLVLVDASSARAAAVAAGGLLLLALVLRTAVGLVLGATGGSVLAAAVLHASFNAANNTGSLVDRVLDGADQGLGAVLALALLALVLAVSRSPRRRHQPGQAGEPRPYPVTSTSKEHA
jgi:uncharacterized protein